MRRRGRIFASPEQVEPEMIACHRKSFGVHAGDEVAAEGQKRTKRELIA